MKIDSQKNPKNYVTGTTLHEEEAVISEDTPGIGFVLPNTPIATSTSKKDENKIKSILQDLFNPRNNFTIKEMKDQVMSLLESKQISLTEYSQLLLAINMAFQEEVRKNELLDELIDGTLTNNKLSDNITLANSPASHLPLINTNKEDDTESVD